MAEWSGDMLRTLTCECPPPLRLRVAAVTVSPPAFLRWPRSVTRVFAVALSPNRRMFPLARSARGDRSSSVPCVRVRPHLRRALPPRIGSVDLSSGCLRDCPISFYVERDKHVEFPSRLKRGCRAARHDLRPAADSAGGVSQVSPHAGRCRTTQMLAHCPLTVLPMLTRRKRPISAEASDVSIFRPAHSHTVPLRNPRGGPATSPFKGCFRSLAVRVPGGAGREGMSGRRPDGAEGRGSTTRKNRVS